MTRSAVKSLIAGFVAFGPSLLLAAESAHAEGTGLIKPPNPWAIASFLVVAAIVVKKILPRIVDAMDRRAEKIRTALEAAERARAEREALIASHAAEVERCRQEALRIIQEGKAEAARLKETLVVEARREAEEFSAKAQREIELAKQAAVDELHRLAVDLTFDLARHLIRKSLNPKDHEDVIRERIRSLPSA